MPKHWLERPPEEAFLFNPAFLSSVMCDFAREFEKAKGESTPVTLVYLSVAISLHRKTRQRFPHSTVTSLYEWIQNNEDVLVDLPRRARGLLPFLKEALMFSLHQEALKFDVGHQVTAGKNKAHFTLGFLDSVTEDFNEVVVGTRFLARWFAKSGSEASILSSWGMRP